MRQEMYRDAAVAAKYKLLTAMAISVTLRCGPCIRAYVRMACEKGISREELLEFLNVAMTMQGCPGEEWALKAYSAYKECLSEPSAEAPAACCAHGTLASLDVRPNAARIQEVKPQRCVQKEKHP